jgi:hypothetical protein
MYKVTAHAIRNGKTIEVTVGGVLPDSCHTASVVDIYPGGSRVYLVDPGAAQVFVEETIKSGSGLCLMILLPWGATVSIPDKEHETVDIYVNNHEVLEVTVVDKEAQFIVIALTGTDTGCSIIPKDAMYPAIYSKVFGPSSYDDCRNWVASNCSQ